MIPLFTLGSIYISIASGAEQMHETSIYFYLLRIIRSFKSTTDVFFCY